MILDKVEAYCRQVNLPIYQFEKRCGLGNGTVSGWKYSMPNYSSMEKVAKEMGITVSELLKEDD